MADTADKPKVGGMNPGMYAKMSAYIFCEVVGFLIGLPIGALAVVLWVML